MLFSQNFSPPQNVAASSPRDECIQVIQKGLDDLNQKVRTLEEERRFLDERVKALEADNNTLKKVASRKFRATLSSHSLRKGVQAKDLENQIIKSSFGGKFIFNSMMEYGTFYF